MSWPNKPIGRPKGRKNSPKAKLLAQERRAVGLKIRGLTFREIALVLGVPESTIKSQLSKYRPILLMAEMTASQLDLQPIRENVFSLFEMRILKDLLSETEQTKMSLRTKVQILKALVSCEVTLRKTQRARELNQVIDPKSN